MFLFCTLSILKGICPNSAGLKIFYLSYCPVLCSLSLSLRLLSQLLRLTLLVRKSKKCMNFFDIISNNIFSPLNSRSPFPLSLSCYECTTGIHSSSALLFIPIWLFWFCHFLHSFTLISNFIELNLSRKTFLLLFSMLVFFEVYFLLCSLH